MKSVHGILRQLVLAAVGATMATAALAEDIDIYSTSGNTDLPNVLVMLDNSANWSASISATCKYLLPDNVTESSEGPQATNPGMEQGTKMAIEKCALYNVIQALPVKPAPATADNNAMFNVGLMLLNESPSSNNGAYPRVAMMR